MIITTDYTGDDTLIRFLLKNEDYKKIHTFILKGRRKLDNLQFLLMTLHVSGVNVVNFIKRIPEYEDFIRNQNSAMDGNEHLWEDDEFIQRRLYDFFLKMLGNVE